MYTIGQFATIVETGRSRYQGNVISWGRSVQHNKTLTGSHPNSFHLMGLAADIWFHTQNEMELCKTFYERAELHVKYNGERTIHVQVVKPQ